MRNCDQARAALKNLPIAEIRSRFAGIVYSRAAAIVDLWLCRRDLLAENVDDDVFAAIINLGEARREATVSCPAAGPKAPCDSR